MKTNLFQLSLLFLLCTSVLCGCANDDEQILSTDGSTLTVHATADGFASADGVNTRASENDYTTTFTEGDQIGVFAVKDGQVITDCNNVPLTYNGTGWEGNAVYYYTGAEYFAYYPYDVNMNDKTSVDDIVKDFTPQSNQSSYANYTKSDLMTADVVSPSPSDKTLRFSFAHKMSLIEISLPVQKYITPDPDKYEYSSPVIGATFSIASNGNGQQSITPYNMGGGVYRYIVSAEVSHTVGGEFQTGGGKTIEYNKKGLSLSAGNYKRLNVSYDGADKAIIRPLAIGDYYYSNGNVCPGDAPNPPSEGCIGIVMKVGRDNGGTDWTDDCTYNLKDGITEMNTVHGYVLALYDANNGQNCTWGSYRTQVEYEGMMNRDQYTGFYGYKNTQAVILFAKSKGWNLQDAFPAVYWGTNGYEDSHPAPANSSGWFLPSAGQCKYWLNNRDELLNSVKKVTGDDSYGWKSWYWSSSEYSSNPMYNACYADFDYGRVLPSSKDSYRYVLACLAF